MYTHIMYIYIYIYTHIHTYTLRLMCVCYMNVAPRGRRPAPREERDGRDAALRHGRSGSSRMQFVHSSKPIPGSSHVCLCRF